MTGSLLDVLVGRCIDVHVTMADLSSNEDLLVLCTTNKTFCLLRLRVLPDCPYVEVQDHFPFQLDAYVHSCKLSHDACLLALGQDNGNIIVSILHYT
jgi:hypothetical protein